MNNSKVQNAGQAGERANPSSAGLALMFFGGASAAPIGWRPDGEPSDARWVIYSQEAARCKKEALKEPIVCARHDSMVTPRCSLSPPPKSQEVTGNDAKKYGRKRLLPSKAAVVSPPTRAPAAWGGVQANPSRSRLGSMALKRGPSEQIPDRFEIFQTVAALFIIEDGGGGAVWVQVDKWGAGWHK